MSHETMINHLRNFHYMLGVLENQQKDPFCGTCISFAKTVEGTKDSFIKFEKTCTAEKREIANVLSVLFSHVYKKMTSIELPETPVGQKKAGNCKLPEGVCLPKAALTAYEKIMG